MAMSLLTDLLSIALCFNIEQNFLHNFIYFKRSRVVGVSELQMVFDIFFEVTKKDH